MLPPHRNRLVGLPLGALPNGILDPPSMSMAAAATGAASERALASMAALLDYAIDNAGGGLPTGAIPIFTYKGRV